MADLRSCGPLRAHCNGSAVRAGVPDRRLTDGRHRSPRASDRRRSRARGFEARSVRPRPTGKRFRRPRPALRRIRGTARSVRRHRREEYSRRRSSRAAAASCWNATSRARTRRGARRSAVCASCSDTLHDVRSISKSIVALAYGAALAEKKVPPPGEPLFTQFPEYADVFDADERRKRLTIEHALTMTLGTAWDETIPWNDPRNSERLMELAPDRYRYILERPVVEEPGQRWVYSAAATALVARIVMRGTGRGRARVCARGAIRSGRSRADGMDQPQGSLGHRRWRTGCGFRPAHAPARSRAYRADVARWRQGGGAPDRPGGMARRLRSSQQRASTTSAGTAIIWYVGNLPYAGPGGQRQARWIAAVGNGGQRLVRLSRS